MASPSPNDYMESKSIELDQSAIAAFASQFDPQPYHLDASAADQSIFGGLCASGWHIAALATRLVIETLLANGLPFVEMSSVSWLKWSRPTFVNEQISVRVTLGTSDEESPIANTRCQTLEIEVCNGNGAIVATMTAKAAIAIDAALAEST